jgi:hypothetical protein
MSPSPSFTEEAPIMRTLVTLTASALTLAALALSAAALADDSTPAASRPPTVVYLNSAALDELAKTNPDHAVRARRILAAAGELCKPGPAEVNYASFQASDIRCTGEILRTSLPAKREIAFTLDDTRYLALVTVPSTGTFRKIDPPAGR